MRNGQNPIIDIVRTLAVTLNILNHILTLIIHAETFTLTVIILTQRPICIDTHTHIHTDCTYTHTHALTLTKHTQTLKHAQTLTQIVHTHILELALIVLTPT